MTKGHLDNSWIDTRSMALARRGKIHLAQITGVPS